MRRKPSASHCVKKLPFADVQARSAWCSSPGAQVVKISSVERVVPSGRLSMHELAVLHAERRALAVDQHAREVQLLAVEAQRLRRARRGCGAMRMRLSTRVLAGSRSKQRSTVSIQNAGGW